jgi:hypothetical protein
MVGVLVVATLYIFDIIYTVDQTNIQQYNRKGFCYIIMAKGKGNGKGKGGFFGAIVEGFGQMAYCICCMMVLGPILIIIGLVTFSSSFNNTRLKLINEYDSSVSTWNNGVGSSGAFKNLKIYAEFSKAGASTANHTVLLGMKAPEGVGDEAKTDSEKFTVIKDPWVRKSF